MRAMKSSVQVLQMELMDARQQAERSAENEGRARAQLQRVLSENDAALVMLGQVFAERFAACCPSPLCTCFFDNCLQREEELEVLRVEFEDVKVAFREQLRSLMPSAADNSSAPQ